MRMIFLFLIWIVVVHATFARRCAMHAVDAKFNVVLQPQRKECFYQKLDSKSTLKFDFQVAGGDGGYASIDWTISTVIKTPRSEILSHFVAEANGNIMLMVPETGIYEFCFNNKFNNVNKKTVYFSIVADESPEKRKAKELEYISANDFLSISKRITEVVKKNVDRIQQYQVLSQAFEGRDINIQEGNLMKIDAFSSIAVVSMIIFAFIELFVLESMFDNRSIIYNVLRILCL